MAPTCNIDAKGQSIRLIGGVITVGIAVLLATLLLLGVITPAWMWFVVLGTAAGGAFQIYEGWAGWCVVRAMGFKTPV